MHPLPLRAEKAEEFHGLTASGDMDQGFEVTLDDGTQLRGRRLLVATGLADELPDVPGLRERWGKDVLHCPFCRGCCLDRSRDQ